MKNFKKLKANIQNKNSNFWTSRIGKSHTLGIQKMENLGKISKFSAPKNVKFLKLLENFENFKLKLSKF